MSVFYRKYQNKNRQSVAYGKWFARAVTIGKTINIDELAKHMSEHNTPYSKGAVKGVLTDMVGCIRELMLEGKAVKLEGLAIFSAGIKTKKNGAPTSADFSTTKHIDSVYMRARATGEFTRSELTKAGNVAELPKNYTDYHKDGEDNGGNQSGNNSGNGGNSGSGGSGVADNFRLVIYKYGSGTSTVTDDSEQELPNDSSVASGSNVNISVVPAAGKVPTAKVNGNSITLTESHGTYTGSFVMPTKDTVLEINSEPSELDFGDGD
jgi:predicted histone-like DNA-binding protein